MVNGNYFYLMVMIHIVQKIFLVIMITISSHPTFYHIQHIFCYLLMLFVFSFISIFMLKQLIQKHALGVPTLTNLNSLLHLQNCSLLLQVHQAHHLVLPLLTPRSQLFYLLFGHLLLDKDSIHLLQGVLHKYRVEHRRLKIWNTQRL
jgi:hypothetical protein